MNAEDHLLAYLKTVLVEQRLDYEQGPPQPAEVIRRIERTEQAIADYSAGRISEISSS